MQLDVRDIFPEGCPTFEGAERSAAQVAALATPKYADGTGRTWTGLGRNPTWLHEALDAGAELDDFLVTDRKPLKSNHVSYKTRRLRKR